LLGSDVSSTGSVEEAGRDGHRGHAKPEKI
jgi:hypothetical protein